MAKENNLKDLLTDVADAIREKKGTTDLINPQDFGSEIRSIESGGGSVEWVEPNESDVNFYDYDGTLLYSYKWEDAEKLTELPTPPNRHKGLIFEGWNYTLEDMLEQGNYANIGALYTTENGRTRIRVKPINYVVFIPVVTNSSSRYKLYWGDGEFEIIDYLTSKEVQHIYPTNEEYFVEIEVIEGYLVFNTSITKTYNENILEINFGSDDINIETYGLKKLKNINKISFNNHISSINSEPIENYINCICLPSTNYIGSKSPVRLATWNKISIPLVLTDFNQTYFERNENCNIVIHSKAKGFTNMSTNSTKSIYRNIKISKNNTEIYGSHNSVVRRDNNELVVGGTTEVLDESIVSIGAYAFQNMVIEKLYIPDNVIDIGNVAFKTEYLYFLSLGKNVKTIGTSGITTPQNPTSIIDATRCDAVPQSASPIKALYVVVDDSKYDDFKAATNWSSLKIVKKSESFINFERNVVFTNISPTRKEGYIVTKNVGEIQNFDIAFFGNFIHSIVQVSGYDVLKITGEGGNQTKLFNFLAEDNTVLSVAPSNEKLNRIEIKIPKDADKVIICSQSALEIQLGKYDS